MAAVAWVPPTEQMCDQSEQLLAVKYTLKINTGCAGRKNVTEDLGSLFKSPCQNSLSVVRKQEGKIKNKNKKIKC